MAHFISPADRLETPTRLNRGVRMPKSWPILRLERVTTNRHRLCKYPPLLPTNSEPSSVVIHGVKWPEQVFALEHVRMLATARKGCSRESIYCDRRSCAQLSKHTLEILIVPALMSYTNHHSQPSTLQLPYSSPYPNPLHSSHPYFPTDLYLPHSSPPHPNTLRFRVRVRNAEPVSSFSSTIILLADLFRYFFQAWGLRWYCIRNRGGKEYDGGERSWMPTL